ncbi:MAG TPA: Spy/CpxP family protein refolding chaperone [Holophagaceae bacterium]|jgi:Spy/CpxP family protein refolding chaperone|nr:Spy/CpxP family protein refolding chaperone [Holophagaceae bacterium]
MRPLAIVLTAILPLAAQTPAPGPQAPGAMPTRVVTALDLTPEQQAQRKAIHGRYRDAARANHEAVRAQAQAFRAAMQDPKASEAQLRQAFDQMNSQRFQGLLQRRAMRQELRATLTPDQQAKADTMRAQFREHRRARMERRIQWMQKRLDQDR